MNSIDLRTQFSARPPSMTWEMITLADAPQSFVWTWFKPSHVPHGLVLTIPDETYRTHPHPVQLTLRNLLQSAGVEPSWVAMWSLYGVAYDGQQGTTPFLNQAIPEPAPGVDRSIVVYLHAPPVATAPQMLTPQMPGPVLEETGQPTELFERMGADWKASLHLEKELDMLRKQLAGMASRLGSLNRDLSPEERLHSSREDQDDWQDARRWLREAASRLSRFIKEHDVGETVYAGKKKRFESIYDQFVVPRQRFNGCDQVQQDYEAYRKMLQTLVNNMRATYSSAGQDGERRAQQVLSRIAAKVQNSRSKR